MSKKHYIMLAKVLKSNKAPFTLCTALSIELQKDNGSFDIERFLDACGYPNMDYVLPV